jgi:hypothetical protein
MANGGKIWKWEKIPFFFPPLIFLQVFLSQVGKKLDQGGKYYIVSPQAQKNTIQHDQGEKHRQRVFSPSTPPAKVEQLIAWPRREKMKTQGEKIKTQWQK